MMCTIPQMCFAGGGKNVISLFSLAVVNDRRAPKKTPFARAKTQWRRHDFSSEVVEEAEMRRKGATVTQSPPIAIPATEGRTGYESQFVLG
jgi:hypothetical protein